MIVVDEERIGNYKIDDSNMVIRLDGDEKLLDKVNSFRVTALSRDEMDREVVKKCEVVVNFTLLKENNQSMWPIGDLPPSKFTANFPGKV